MKSNFPNITDYKIVLTVKSLNERGFYPLPEGVLKILSGHIDEETEQFQDLETFQSLISFNSKQVSRLINMLVRYHYLGKKYDPETDKLYLNVTDKGEAFLMEYKHKHRVNLNKHTKVFKKTIVKI